MKAEMEPVTPVGPAVSRSMQGCCVRPGIHSDKHALLSLDVGPVELKLSILSLTRTKPQHSAEVYENLMPLHMSQTQRETWQKSCFFNLPNLSGMERKNMLGRYSSSSGAPFSPVHGCSGCGWPKGHAQVLKAFFHSGIYPSRQRCREVHKITDMPRKEEKAWESCPCAECASGDHPHTHWLCATCTRQASDALTVPDKD